MKAYAAPFICPARCGALLQAMHMVGCIEVGNDLWHGIFGVSDVEVCNGLVYIRYVVEITLYASR
ncbi:MAG: hypothetical protein WDO15_09555 [Bacteroidota bacterium]